MNVISASPVMISVRGYPSPFGISPPFIFSIQVLSPELPSLPSVLFVKDGIAILTVSQVRGLLSIHLVSKSCHFFLLKCHLSSLSPSFPPGFLLSIAGFLPRASLEGAESRGAGISSDAAPSIGNFLQVLVFSRVIVVSTLQDYSGD